MKQAIILAKNPQEPCGTKATTPARKPNDRGPIFTSDGRVIERMMREGKKLKPLLGSGYDMMQL